MKLHRYSPQQRRRMILHASVAIAADERLGFSYVTPAEIAKACPVPTSEATVRHYFPRRGELVRAIVDEKSELKDIAKQYGFDVD